MMRQDRRRGSAMVEFAIVGIPLIFIWISIVQMSLGMWHYHTLQYAVKVASSYMAMHGTNCNTQGNTCGIQIQDAARVLQAAAIGIPPNSLSVKFTPYGTDHVTAAGGSYPLTCTLDNCVNDSTAYPPAGYGDPGCDIRIEATYTFHSALGMVVPGAGYVHFGTYTFKSDTQQTILF